jgi:hypothetical protein
MDAAAAADLDTIRLLVEAGANINFKSAIESSPMNQVLASIGFQNTVLEGKHLDCIRYFLDLGLDINNQESEWETGGLTIVRTTRVSLFSFQAQLMLCQAPKSSKAWKCRLSERAYCSWCFCARIAPICREWADGSIPGWARSRR